MSNTLRFFYSTIRLSWGFTVRYREVSAAQPAYVLPPPTTVVGAFAYPLARILGFRDVYESGEKLGNGVLVSKYMKPFLEATRAASAGVITDMGAGLAVHSEISKISAVRYKGDTERRRMMTTPFSNRFYTEALPKVFPALAVGSTYGPGATLLLSWVVDASKLSKSLGLKEEDIDSVGPIASHGVSRIGSKEGLVASDPEGSGYVKNPRILASSPFKTIQYVIKKCAEPLYTAPEVELPYLDYRLRKFYVPSIQASNALVVPLKRGELLDFTLQEPCKAYVPLGEGLEPFTSVGI